MGKGDAKPKAGGDKKGGPAQKKKGRSLSSLYTISGDKIERKNRSCPKCGSGIFLGVHTNRLVCGKCAYVEFVKSK